MSQTGKNSVRTIPFIAWDDSTQLFSIGTEANEIISRLTNHHIAIILACGRQGTGKSTLLNELLNLPNTNGGGGFPLRSQPPPNDSRTRGIWMSTRIDTVHIGNDPMHIIYMEGEGLSLSDKPTTRDSILFALCTALSSILLVNFGSSSIDDSTILHASVVSTLPAAFHIHRQTNGNTNAMATIDSSEDVAKEMPNLIWLLKDCDIDPMDEDGNPLSFDEYLENSLRDKQAFDKETRERNKVRRTIRNLFIHRSCIGLAAPNDRSNRNENITLLRNLTIENTSTANNNQPIKPKTVLGVPVTGGTLLSLTQAYLNSLNKTLPIVVADAWDIAVANECSRIAAQAHARYTLAMSPGGNNSNSSSSGNNGRRLSASSSALLGGQSLPPLPLDDNMVLASHENAMATALSFYENNIPHNSSSNVIESSRTTLRKRILATFEEVRSANIEASTTACRTLVRDLTNHYLNDFVDNLRETVQNTNGSNSSGNRLPYILNELWDLWENQILKDYKSRAVGPRVDNILAHDGIRILQDTLDDIASIVDSGTVISPLATSGSPAPKSSSSFSSSPKNRLDTTELSNELYEETSTALAAITIELADVSARLNQTRTDYEALKVTNANLQQELNVARAAAATVAVTPRRNSASGTSASTAPNPSQTQEITNLTNQLNEKLSTIAKLTQELSTAKQDLTVSRTETRTTQNELSLVREQLTTVQESIQTYTEELNALQDELQVKQNQINTAEKERDKANKELSLVKDDLNRTKAALDRLREDNSALVVSMESAGKEATARRRDSAVASAALATAQAEAQRLRGELHAVQLERDRALAQAAAASTEREEMEATVEELRKSAETSTGTLKEQVSTLTTTLSTTKTEHESQIRRLEDERNTALNNLEGVKVDLNAAQALCDEFEEDLRNAEQSVKTLRNDLQQTNTKLTTANNRIKELESSLNTIASNGELQKSVFMEAEKHITDLTADRDRLASELANAAIALAKATAESGVYKRELESTKEALLKYQAAATAAETDRAGTGASLSAVRDELVETQARHAAARNEIAGLSADVETLRNQVSELNGRVEKITLEKKTLEAQLADVNSKSKGSKVPASVEGLRTANKEYERAVDKLTSDLHAVTVQRNTAEARLEEARRRIDTLEEDLAIAQKRWSDALAEREVALGNASSSDSKLSDTVAKLQAAEASAVARAAAVEAEMNSLLARIQSAETEAAEAKAVRLAMEKAQRSTTLELATARETISKLEASLHAQKGERANAIDAVDGVRNELQIIGAKASAALKEREKELKEAEKARKELVRQLRRRDEVDGAMAVLRGGAEVTKYKLSGSRAIGETRFVALTNATSVLGPNIGIDAAAAAGRNAPDNGEVLAWSMPGRKVWSKGVRIADISAVVMGVDSPTFKRYLSTEGRNVRLDATRCFTVIVKGGSALIGNKASNKPVPDQGITLDFELPSAADCTSWVYGLRSLQLRSANKPGFGPYSLSRIAVKMQRIGLKVRRLAAEEGSTPREFLDRLRNEAWEDVGKTLYEIRKARTALRAIKDEASTGIMGSSKLFGSTKGAGAMVNNSSKANVTTKGSTTTATKGPVNNDDSDDDLPVFAKSTKPVTTATTVSNTGTKGGSNSNVNTSKAVVTVTSDKGSDDSDDGMPVFAKGSGSNESKAKPSATSTLSTPNVSSSTSSTPLPDGTKKPPTKQPLSNGAARNALFAGHATPETSYVSPGTYSANRAKTTPSASVAPVVSSSNRKADKEKAENEAKEAAARDHALGIFEMAKAEKEAKERAKQEAEEKARKEAEEKARKQKQEAETAARKQKEEAEEKARKQKEQAEAEAKAKAWAEAEEQMKRSRAKQQSSSYADSDEDEEEGYVDRASRQQPRKNIGLNRNTRPVGPPPDSDDDENSDANELRFGIHNEPSTGTKNKQQESKEPKNNTNNNGNQSKTQPSSAQLAKQTDPTDEEINMDDLIADVEMNADAVGSKLPGERIKLDDLAPVNSLSSSSSASTTDDKGKKSGFSLFSRKKQLSPEEEEAKRRADEEKRIEEERKQAAIEATKAMSSEIIGSRRKDRDSDEDNDDDTPVRVRRSSNDAKIMTERDALFAGRGKKPVANTSTSSNSTGTSGSKATANPPAPVPAPAPTPTNSKSSTQTNSSVRSTATPAMNNFSTRNTRTNVDDEEDLPSPPPPKTANGTSTRASLFGAKKLNVAESNRSLTTNNNDNEDNDNHGGGSTKRSTNRLSKRNYGNDDDGDEDYGSSRRSNARGNAGTSSSSRNMNQRSNNSGPPPDSDEDDDRDRFGFFAGGGDLR